MSKDIKPKIRLGQTAASRRNRIIAWTVFLRWQESAAFTGTATPRQETKVEVPVAQSADVPNS